MSKPCCLDREIPTQTRPGRKYQIDISDDPPTPPLPQKIEEIYDVYNHYQLNIALILLSNDVSSKLSILIAWKYSLGSKYPFAIKKLCLSTNS